MKPRNIVFLQMLKKKQGPHRKTKGAQRQAEKRQVKRALQETQDK